MEIIMAKEVINQQFLTGERALFARSGLEIHDTIFDNGESPLKECSDIDVTGSMFRWKYPLWYCRDITVRDTTWFEMARAGVWYSDSVSVYDSVIEAPKNFRRCRGLKLDNVTFVNAAETLWHCSNVAMNKVTAKGDYFALDSDNMKISDLTLVGNYSFDGVKNVEVSNSKLITKDAFWNSDNVTVRGCLITGEYLGWNAKNLTFEDCTIESLQGLCYIDNLVMRNCKLLNTTLAFEYSSVDAEIVGNIDSVLNPSSGRITADSIGELIIERDKVDPDKTKIICKSEEASLAGGTR